jgi:hypothetical protein
VARSPEWLSHRSTRRTKAVRVISKKQAKKLDKKIELTPGPEGDPRATRVTARLGPGSALVDANQNTSDTASCEPGEVATGGGYFLLGDATHARVYNNRAQDGTKWQVNVDNDSEASNPVGVRAQVNCAAP